MTEIQKARNRKYPREWQKWFSLVGSLGLVFAAIAQSTFPNNVPGAIACVWLSLIVLAGAYNFSDRRLSQELVGEIDDLRLELEQLKAKRAGGNDEAG